YTELSQAIKLSEIYNGSASKWDWGTIGNVRPSFDEYWAPYLKIIKYCETADDCGYDNSNPWKRPNGAPAGLGAVFPLSRTTVVLANGSILVVVSYAGQTGSLAKYIFVDTNGSKKPNQYGKDGFFFELEEGKGLMPYRYSVLTETEINNNCSKNGDGGYCSAKLMRDGWQIKNDYPW
ncbi:MAG: hypothetical protein PHC64_09985, partial [Candidatus Gastranaerophilales bacterium]|nr:hypothetical protein [Candidatus Gastranaerophilales bacterium]